MPSKQGETQSSPPAFDERGWVIQIQKTLSQVHDYDDDGDDDFIEVPVSIFAVPKSMTTAKPEAYTPQEVAIGPYHQWRPELYEMERYKFYAARRTQQKLMTGTFEEIVTKFMKFDYMIRASYDRYLDVGTETLAWMMAVDSAFLLEYIQIFAVDASDDKVTRVPSKMSQVVDYSGKKMSHNAVLRDIIMLENQIPLFLLKEALEFSNPENPDELLAKMLMGFCKSLSPFKARGVSVSKDELLRRHHLLELLYYDSVPQMVEAADDIKDVPTSEDYIGFFKRLSNATSSIQRSPFFHCFRQVFASTKLKSIVKFPFQVIFKTRIVSSSTNHLQRMMAWGKESGFKKEDIEDAEAPNPDDERPKVEELMIPNVSELFNAGVTFCATKGDISVIKFDATSGSFHLPIISVDENSEVVLRNLVAFEAAVASGPLVFTRYTELINGIIDTEEDVKLLREKGILFNHLKSDGEAAKLWNGMSRSVTLTKVAQLDKVIEDVNRYYSARWKVWVEKLMKKYVFSSWPLLTFMGANLLLGLTGLQAVCSVYNCKGLILHSLVGSTNTTLTYE